MFVPRGSSSRIAEAVRRGVSRRPWAKARTVMDWASQKKDKKETWSGLEVFVSISSELAGVYLWLSIPVLTGPKYNNLRHIQSQKHLPCCVLLRMTLNVELRKAESCCVIHWSPGTLGSTLFNRSLERKETFQSRPRHGAWLYLRGYAPRRVEV